MPTLQRICGNLPSIFLGIIIGLAGNAALTIAWTGPTDSAPSNNVSAPINVGTTAQVKNGDVGFNYITAFGNIRLAGGWGSTPTTTTYLNFSNIQYPSAPVWGSSGYGIRDNNGTLEFKNSGSSWANLNTLVQSYLSAGSVTQIKFSDATTQTTAGITAESDPEVGTVDATKICVSNSAGTAINCNHAAPAYTSWSGWNSCSGACGTGNGTQSRARSCNITVAGITWSVSCSECGGVCADSQSCTASRCSCFTKDALVMMADGTSKEIHEVKVGDRVVGEHGINTVLGLDHTLLWKGKPQHLISINDGRAVMTDNHPVMTTRGWRAVNPMLAEKEAFDILSGKVGTLSVGDEIVTVTGNIRVASISVEPQSDTPTRLYNLYLDGDHTFYSNSMLVHGVVPDKEGRFTLDTQHGGEEE